MPNGQWLLIISKTSLPFGHRNLNLNEWQLLGKRDLRGNGDKARKPAIAWRLLERQVTTRLGLSLGRLPFGSRGLGMAWRAAGHHKGGPGLRRGDV